MSEVMLYTDTHKAAKKLIFFARQRLLSVHRLQSNTSIINQLLFLPKRETASYSGLSRLCLSRNREKYFLVSCSDQTK